MESPPLRVLFVEDVAADAELAAAELRRSGLSFVMQRVETREQLVAALAAERPDLVLSDYSLPGFDGMAALAVVLERAPGTPFLLLTGSTNEEIAVACMRAGAWDYVLKDRLSRLPLAVRGALDRAAALAHEREVQEALRESEARFHLLAEAAPVGIFQTAGDGRTTYVNRRWSEISGLTAEDALGSGWLRAVHPEDREALAAGWTDAAGAGRASDAEYRFVRPDGTVVWVVGRAVALTDAKGRATGYVGTILDISERKRAEEALRASEQRYRLVLENSLDGQLLTSPDGTIHAANAAACAMFGRSEEEIVRLGRDALIDTTDPRLGPALAERARTGRFRGLLTALRADGTKFPIELSSSVFRDASGVPRTSMAIRDVTQQQALEAQLRQVQKMEAIGSLAAGVAHDFNNILQAMLSHIQLLRASDRDPARVAAAAAELEQQIGRGAALTRQLLLFSRHETVKKQVLDLNEAVRASAQLLRRLVRENIAFGLEPCAGVLPVLADPGHLDQVLVNLVVNAADAMPEGGTLRVATGRGDGDVPWVTVTDTGCGISEEIRHRVFEPFFTTKAPGKGTGIGLAVVQGIVEECGGTIALDSTVGRGTTVRITFPPVASPVPADGPPSGDRPLVRGRGERVLVVEDEPGAREGLAEILTSLGYTVVAAASGEEALALPAGPEVVLLLTDLMLPGIAGPELAGALAGRWPQLRVILMSGYTEDEATKRRIAARLVRFLQKPFSMVTLASEVRAALDEAGDGR